MRLVIIEGVLSLGLYWILEMLLRDSVPAIARASDTWQSWVFPLLVGAMVVAFCELMLMRKQRSCDERSL